MPNIIERLTGANLSDSSDKLSIHAFTGAFNEWGRGKITAQSVINAFNLDASQVTQVQGLAGLWTAAPDKVRFMRVFKDLLYMGETSLNENYQSITFLNTRLQEEVTDQGGTLP